MSYPQFVPQDCEDTYAQENFRRVGLVFNANIFQSMSLLELQFGKAETNLSVPHRLNFRPEDVIITQKKGTGAFSVDHEKTTRENLTVTTTGACTVRLLIGTIGSV